MRRIGPVLAATAAVVAGFTWPVGGDGADPSPPPVTVHVEPLTTDPVTPAAPPSTLPPPISGDCETYRPHMDAAGLPADIFLPIAWRETRCNYHARVTDHDDQSAGLLQFNFHANTGTYWTDLCGLTWENATDDLDRQLRCAAAAYVVLGLDPWQ